MSGAEQTAEYSRSLCRLQPDSRTKRSSSHVRCGTKPFLHHPFAHRSLMSDKAKKHPLSNRPPKKADASAESATPIIPIHNSGLAEALKAGGRVYELMVDSVRDYAIFMLDPDGHVASWNKGAQRIKGYTASEIIGRHFSTFYPPEDIASDKPARELKIATRQGRFEEEGTRLR